MKTLLQKYNFNKKQIEKIKDFGKFLFSQKTNKLQFEKF
jgi:hypothetical protein